MPRFTGRGASARPATCSAPPAYVGPKVVSNGCHTTRAPQTRRHAPLGPIGTRPASADAPVACCSRSDRPVVGRRTRRDVRHVTLAAELGPARRVPHPTRRPSRCSASCRRPPAREDRADVRPAREGAGPAAVGELAVHVDLDGDGHRASAVVHRVQVRREVPASRADLLGTMKTPYGIVPRMQRRHPISTRKSWRRLTI